jgi:hypothetical protein
LLIAFSVLFQNVIDKEYVMNIGFC